MFFELFKKWEVILPAGHLAEILGRIGAKIPSVGMTEAAIFKFCSLTAIEEYGVM